METSTRITVPLSQPERAALFASAQNAFRDPRAQARYLLRLVLLGAEESPPAAPTNSNRAGDVLADTSAAADVSTIPSHP